MAEKSYKKCPGCANEIKASASYCIHCKSLINKPDQGVRQTKSGNRVQVGAVSQPGGGSKADANIDRMELKIDDLYNIVNQVNQEIARTRNVTQQQSDTPLGLEKIKEIIHYFTNAYNERMENSITTNFAVREYAVEEKKLQASLGEEVWDKLDHSSQTLLVSARIMYNDLMALDKKSDYTGVCLLAVKALEKEMIRRFYTQYIKFLENRYPVKTKIKAWPTPLLNKYDRKKITKKYTLIGITYILCYAVSNANSAAQIENNKKKLLEYGRKKLFLKGSDDEVMERSLHRCAEGIESFCNDYRNPLALTTGMDTIGAEDCAGLLNDIEAFLKTTIQEFAF